MTDLREPFPLEVEAPEGYSQTLLRHADFCEYAAALYVAQDGGVASHPMERGSAFHTFAERWLRGLIDRAENVGDPEEAKTLLDTILDEGYVVPGKEQDGLRVMAHNFADMRWIDPSEVVAVEDKFDVELAGRMVTGKIDYAAIHGGTAEIEDYKTSYAITPTDDFVGNFQTALYAVAVAEGKIRGEPLGLGSGVTVFDVRESYPRYAWQAEGTLAYRSEQIDYAGILDRKLYLERLVRRVDRAFAAQKFRAIPSSHCNECPTASECPLPARMRNWQGELTVTDPLEKAQEVATRWWFKSEGKARAEDAGGPSVKADWALLKAWVDENGPLRFGADLILEYATVEKEELKRSKGFGKDAFREAIEKAADGGPPVIWKDWHRNSISTRLTLRTLSSRELAEDSNDE